MNDQQETEQAFRDYAQLVRNGFAALTGTSLVGIMYAYDKDQPGWKTLAGLALLATGLPIGALISLAHSDERFAKAFLDVWRRWRILVTPIFVLPIILVSGGVCFLISEVSVTIGILFLASSGLMMMFWSKLTDVQESS